MSFKLSKVAGPPVKYTYSGLYNKKKVADDSVVLTEDQIESMAAEGLSRKEMAARVGLRYGTFNSRLARSHKLCEAENIGKRRTKNGQL